MHVDPVLNHEVSYSFQSLSLDGFLRDIGWGIAVFADMRGRDMSLEKPFQKLIILEKAFYVGVKRFKTGDFR